MTTKKYGMYLTSKGITPASNANAITTKREMRMNEVTSNAVRRKAIVSSHVIHDRFQTLRASIVWMAITPKK